LGGGSLYVYEFSLLELVRACSSIMVLTKFLVTETKLTQWTDSLRFLKVDQVLSSQARVQDSSKTISPATKAHSMLDRASGNV
jgi:hypothetical protein